MSDEPNYFKINKTQLSIYSDLLKLINKEKYLEAKSILLEVKNSDPFLYDVLLKRKVDKGLDYWLNKKDLLSEKIERIMDFIDGSYIHSN